MTFPKTALAWIVYVLSVFLMSRYGEARIANALTAPLFVLVPMGFGLSLLGLKDVLERLGRLFGPREVILAATLLGWVLTTVSYSMAELYHQTTLAISIGGILLVVFAAIGFQRAVPLFRAAFSIESQTDRAYWLGYVLTAAVAYYFCYIQFTAYPLRDVFQDVHFMKGAHEFSRFGVLNRFTADSYIPLLQVHLGLLHHFFGFDLLRAQWTIPIVMFAFQIFGLRSFFQSLPLSRWAADFGVLISIILFRTIFSKSNGDLLMIGSLVLFAMWRKLRENDQARIFARGRWIDAAVIIGSLLVFRLKQLHNPTIFFECVVLTAALFFLRGTRYFKYVWLTLFAAVSVALHRSVIMFIPTVLIWDGIFSYWAARSRDQLRSLSYRRIWIFATGIYFILTVFLGTFFFGSFFGIELPNLFSGAATFIFQILSGKNLSDLSPVDGNAGTTRNTVFEWIRASIPVVHVLTYTLLTALAFRKDRVDDERDSANLGVVMGAVVVIALSTFLTFSGIPFVYRGQFFTVLFHIVLVAVCFEAASQSAWLDRWKPRLAFVSFIGFFAFASARKFYNFNWDHALIANPYISRLFPINQVLLIALTVVGLILVFRAVRDWKMYFAVFIVSALMLDSLSIITKFYEYTYGSRFPEPKVISHYEPRDLKIAELLMGESQDTVLVSDPFTASTVKAMTGLNVIFTNENVWDLSLDRQERMQKTLRALLTGADELEAEMVQNIGLGRDLGGEAEYAFERAHGEGSYKAENVRSKIVFLLTHRSFDWLNTKYPSYYPDYQDLEPAESAAIEKNLDVIARIDRYAIIARLKSNRGDSK